MGANPPDVKCDGSDAVGSGLGGAATLIDPPVPIEGGVTVEIVSLYTYGPGNNRCNAARHVLGVLTERFDEGRDATVGCAALPLALQDPVQRAARRCLNSSSKPEWSVHRSLRRYLPRIQFEVW